MLFSFYDFCGVKRSKTLPPFFVVQKGEKASKNAKTTGTTGQKKQKFYGTRKQPLRKKLIFKADMI